MKIISSLTKKQWVFIFFLGLALAMWLAVIFLGSSKYADEGTHARQIGRFLKGNYAILADLTTIPGYHATIAVLAQAFHNPTSRDLRLVSFLLSLLSVWVFFLIAKKLNYGNPLTRTLQFIFLPISFFYFPLLYTDIFALLLILIAFYFALNKRFAWSALFSLAAVLTRQTNIVWIAFIWLYSYISIFGFSFSLQKIISYVRQTIGYIAVFIAFIVFVVLNKGVAIGDRLNQQTGLYPGNLYFFLAVAGILFLPLLIGSLYRLELIKNKKLTFLSLALGALVAGSFVFFLPALHMYNMKLAFLRNLALHFAYLFPWVYAAAIFIGFFTLTQLKLKREALLLFPFAIASLLPSFLVEQRYYIVPLVFLLLLRQENERKTEFALVLYFLALDLALLYMLFNLSLFF